MAECYREQISLQRDKCGYGYVTGLIKQGNQYRYYKRIIQIL